MKRKAPTATPKQQSAPHDHKIVGHDAQRKFYRDLLAKDRFPSTILLAGPGGIGKRLVASEIARSLFCEQVQWGGCSTCPACMLLKAQNTPDLYQINFDDSEQGSVEYVRELLYSLQLKSFAGKNRVVIFDNAHQMSIQVTNVLLKHLEEPRPNTYFILISSSKAKLLPTLLSRCQTTHFETLSADQIRTILADRSDLIPTTVDAAEYDLLIELADGSFENLASVSQELSRARSIAEQFDLILDGDSPTATKLSSELAKDKEALSRTLRLVIILLRAKLLKSLGTPKVQRLAFSLQNAVACERLALDRNLSANYLLSVLSTQLLPRPAGMEPLLIEQVVV